ncbi:GyrI-like domain-containing protein [Aggregatimonas sangjinii]|uniref:GyrI-like domain-containing protein n=1 Tax=Aggregatimonas sangjinii TaxID=2583587 RepID=A0A5B7SYC6_9FLAO|nr:GyrI-like domain-containing protein [Aggregatimonas sangjinii]QCX01780.1 GyrI-like domain-containing protein [Aggregatimonas sangjinii]
MFLRIEKLPEKLMVGKSVRMSLIENKTAEVWLYFMRNRSRLNNTVGSDLYSIQVYDQLNYFEHFNPHTKFLKWAAIEVESIGNIPDDFKAFTLDPGLYAVFLHKGLASEFQKTVQYIFGQWLPQSSYELDDRPHFELLGGKYKNNDPNSEEEVWIPIRDLNRTAKI